MGKFDGILICTDLDGTLLKNDKTVSMENLEAIEYFKAEGGAFTFVTGRMPCSLSRILKMVRPNVPIGCINGGGLYDLQTGKYLWMRALEDSALELVDYAVEQIEGIGVQANTFETIWFSHENSAMKKFREQTGAPDLRRHYREIGEPLAKIVFGDEREGGIDRLDKLLKSHPRADEFDLISSDPMLYEILPKGSNKGVVLPRLVEVLGLDIKKAIAVGDYYNDLEMLRAAGVGIAVANAVPEVKVAADRVTVSNEEHAIARIISDIESGELVL